ncbi:MAG: hypothetical protein HY927_09120 [Elusimicrobia bacterium]|nr:hypothetical protein [Elusimicrobiota bacterium]
MPRESLPPISEFPSAYHPGGPGREFLALARAVDPEAVCRALEAGGGEEGERLLTAVELAPFSAAAAPALAPRLAAGLAARIACAAAVSVPRHYPAVKVSDRALQAFARTVESLKPAQGGQAVFAEGGRRRSDDLASLGQAEPSAPELARGLREAFANALAACLPAGRVAEAAAAFPSAARSSGLLESAREGLGNRSLKPGQRWQCWLAARALTERTWDESLKDAFPMLAGRSEEPGLLWLVLADLVRRHGEGCILLAKSRGAPAQALPPVELLHAYMEGGGGVPAGLGVVPERVAAAALVCDPGEVLSHLASPEDAGRAIAAALVAPALASKDPGFARRALPALRASLADARPYRARVPDHSGEPSPEGEDFRLCSTALRSYLELASRLAGPALDDALAAGIRKVFAGAETGRNASLFVVESFGPALRAVGAGLAAVVGDRSLAAPQRVTAYEVLKASAGDAAKAACRTHLEEPFARASRALLGEVDDPAADPALASYVRANIAAVASSGQAVSDPSAMLQRSGYGRVPALWELFAGGCDPDPGKVDAAAGRAAPEQVLEAMAGDDPSRALAAVYLAPAMEPRCDWAVLALALRSFIGADRAGPAPAGRGAVDAVEVAAERLHALLTDRARRGDERAARFLWEAFGVLMDERPWRRQSCSVVYRFTGDLKRLRRDDLLGDLLMRARDGRAPATLRWRAWTRLCTDFGWPEGRPLAVAAMADAGEDAGFKALLGTRLLDVQPDALDRLLDRSKTPWRFKGPPVDLPLLRPSGELPLECLVSSVRWAPDRETLREAVLALAARLIIRDAGDMAFARDSLLGAAAPAQGRREGFVRALRAAVDGELAGEGRVAAARLLALLGEDQDIERVAAACLEGTWVPFPFPGPRWEPASVLRDARGSVEASGEVWSSIDPYLLAGYGARADKVRALALFQLGRKHAAEKRFERSRPTLARAVGLDGGLRAREAL